MTEFPARYLDASTARQAADFTDHYRSGGWYRDDAEPNSYFKSLWYALENNDWSMCASPFDHYLRVGMREGRDPSPFVDFTALAAGHSRRSRPAVYAHLVHAGAGPSQGVYSSPAELDEIRAQYLSHITPSVISRPQAKRANLVFLQHRESPQCQQWTADPNRSFDVLANHFDASDLSSSRDADCRVVQPGTKFSGVSRTTTIFPELLTGYRYVMLIDDDVDISGAGIEQAFAETKHLDAALAQPGLADGSDGAWAELFAGHQPGKAIETNTVEVMMPIFSASLFERVLPFFAESVSGYGLDMMWGSLLTMPNERAYRLGSVTAAHKRPVDRKDGAYYSYLRDHLINPNAELWSLVTRHGLRRSIKEKVRARAD